MLANIISNLRIDRRTLPSLSAAVFGVALVAFIVDAGGGPGWGGSAAHTVLAVSAEQHAASPLYDALASVFVLLPAGEPGFRLGVLAALLAALTLAGVVAGARALLPKDPAAGAVVALLLAVAPPFREAAAFAAPGMLAAAGLPWSVALAIRFARERDARDAVLSLAATLAVIGSAPWLGGALLVAQLVGLARAGAPRGVLAAGAGASGIAIVLLWATAAGSLPGAGSSLASLAAAGRGAGAIVIGTGLLGAAFAAATALAHARWIAIAIVLAIAHEAVFGGSGAALLAALAIGAAVVPSAIVRAVAAASTGIRRHVVTLAAGAPLLGVAALIGPTITVEDPGATPAELAHDLVDALPPGRGIFVATRPPSWLTVQHEMIVAGARPDLALVPPLPPQQADAYVANALRGSLTVGADAAAFGRLDISRAIPRGRGFQLVGETAPAPTSVPGPADYDSELGREQAILLALERARFEAANGRLDAAARAAGLATRFGAADLAILGATVPSKDRPALFGFLPTRGVVIGPWLLDTFGDDLAWVAGIAIPEIDAHAPMPRQLHARWRAIALGQLRPDDPSIAALGEEAVAATRALFAKK